MCGFLVVDQIDKCVGETELAIGVSSFAGDSRASYQSVISPENQCHSIQQKQFFLHHIKIKQNPESYSNALDGSIHKVIITQYGGNFEYSVNINLAR